MSWLRRRGASSHLAMPMKTPADMPEGWRVYFARGRDGFDDIFAVFVLRDAQGEKVGELHISEYAPKHWYVPKSFAHGGWGPLLYEVAMEWVTKQGGNLTSDNVVSDEAAPVWTKFKSRDDITRVQVPSKGEVTPREMRPRPRDESALQYGYQKPDDVRLRELQEHGRLYETPYNKKPWLRAPRDIKPMKVGRYLNINREATQPVSIERPEYFDTQTTEYLFPLSGLEDHESVQVFNEDREPSDGMSMDVGRVHGLPEAIDDSGSPAYEGMDGLQRLTLSAAGFAGYWVSPSGDVHRVDQTHAHWALKNPLKHNIDMSKATDVEDVVDLLIKHGWTRVRMDGIEVNNMENPSLPIAFQLAAEHDSKGVYVCTRLPAACFFAPRDMRTMEVSLRKMERVAQSSDVDALVHAVQNALDDELLHPKYRDKPEGAHSTYGHCYASVEALYYLLGGPESGYRQKVIRAVDWPEGEGSTHWFLEGPGGEVVDPTRAQFGDEEPPYHLGRGVGFQGKPGVPSHRAQEIIDRVQWLLGETSPSDDHTAEVGHSLNDLTHSPQETTSLDTSNPSEALQSDNAFEDTDVRMGSVHTTRHAGPYLRVHHREHRTAGRKTLQRLLTQNPDDAEVLNELAAGDPTSNHDWLEGMYRWYRDARTKNALAADARAIIMLAHDLDRYRDVLKASGRGTNPAQYDSYWDAKFEVSKEKAAGTRPRMRKRDAQYEVVHQTPDLTIYRIDNKEAACTLGADSDWCSTKWQQNWYEDRVKMWGGNTVYIARLKDGRAYMLRVDGNGVVITAFDKRDNDVHQTQDDGYEAVVAALVALNVIREATDDWEVVLAVMTTVLEQHDVWAHGGDPRGFADEWMRESFTPGQVDSWLDSGIYSPSMAGDLRDEGITPIDIAEHKADLQSAFEEPVGDIDQTDIVDFIRGRTVFFGFPAAHDGTPEVVGETEDEVRGQYGADDEYKVVGANVRAAPYMVDKLLARGDALTLWKKRI